MPQLNRLFTPDSSPCSDAQRIPKMHRWRQPCHLRCHGYITARDVAGAGHRAFTAAPKSWKVMLVDDQDDEVDVTFAKVLLMGDCSVLMCLWINCVRWCVGRGWRFVNRINKGRTQRSLKEGEKELLSKSWGVVFPLLPGVVRKWAQFLS